MNSPIFRSSHRVQAHLVATLIVVVVIDVVHSVVGLVVDNVVTDNEAVVLLFLIVIGIVSEQTPFFLGPATTSAVDYERIIDASRSKVSYGYIIALQ